MCIKFRADEGGRGPPEPLEKLNGPELFNQRASAIFHRYQGVFWIGFEWSNPVAAADYLEGNIYNKSISQAFNI